MNDSFDEQLTRRLASLQTDLDDARLPGPAVARRRAAQRTRHQVTGSILAGVAAVAIGMLGMGDTVFSTTPDPAPPANTSEPSPTGTPTTTEVELGAALLTPADLAGDTGTAWAETGEPGVPVACDPRAVVDTISSGPARDEITLAADSVGRVHQELLRFPGDIDLGALFAETVGCLPDRASGELPQVVDTLEILEVGDEGWMVRYYTDPDDPQADAVTIAVTRYRDVVSITVRTEPTENTTGDIDLNTPVQATERICDVLFGTDCVGDPGTVEADLAGTEPDGDPVSGDEETTTEEPEQSEPAESPGPVLLELADDPYLASDDLDPVGVSRFGFSRAPDFPEGDQFAFRCMADLSNLAADPFLSAHWFSEVEASVTEFVLRMPDPDSAFRIISAHTILPDQCGDVVETHEQTVSEPVVIDVDGADEALAWTVYTEPLPEDPGSSTSFHGVAMARSANVVVVVSFGAMGDATDGGWNDYAARTLAAALDRAIS